MLLFLFAFCAGLFLLFNVEVGLEQELSVPEVRAGLSWGVRAEQGTLQGGVTLHGRRLAPTPEESFVLRCAWSCLPCGRHDMVAAVVPLPGSFCLSPSGLASCPPVWMLPTPFLELCGED